MTYSLKTNTMRHTSAAPPAPPPAAPAVDTRNGPSPLTFKFWLTSSDLPLLVDRLMRFRSFSMPWFMEISTAAFPRTVMPVTSTTAQRRGGDRPRALTRFLQKEPVRYRG